MTSITSLSIPPFALSHQAHYTNPQPTLKCPLRVSERPDPSLQWPKFSRRHSEKLVHPKATWCHIGTGPVYAEKQLAGTATGSFVVYEADSASDHVLVEVFPGFVRHVEVGHVLFSFQIPTSIPPPPPP